MPSNPNEGDKELILACVAGNQAAWSTFMRRHAATLKLTARTVRARKRAWECEEEDMVGHVVERLLEDHCRRLAAWRGDARLTTYLIQVARNLCIDYIAAQARYRNVPETVPPPEKWINDAEEREDAQKWANRRTAVEAAVEQLSPKQAMILRMRMDGYSLRQIAQALRLPPGSVSVESARAIEKLRSVMNEMTSTPTTDEKP